MVQIERLVSENKMLRQAKLELEAKTARQEEEIQNTRLEINKIQAALFRTSSEVDVFRSKEDIRQKTEQKLVDLRKEFVLLGEIQRRYRDHFSTAAEADFSWNSEHVKMLKGAFDHQMALLETSCVQAKTEADMASGRLHDLEASLSKKDHVISEQKRLLSRVSVKKNAQKHLHTICTSLAMLTIRTIRSSGRSGVDQERVRGFLSEGFGAEHAVRREDPGAERPTRQVQAGRRGWRRSQGPPSVVFSQRRRSAKVQCDLSRFPSV